MSSSCLVIVGLRPRGRDGAGALDPWTCERCVLGAGAVYPLRHREREEYRMTVPPLDLGPQTRVIALLAEAVTDDQLGNTTPCPKYAVHNLLGHLLHLSAAFRDAARKDLGPTTDTPPTDSVPDIGPGRREELPKVLDELDEACRHAAAWP